MTRPRHDAAPAPLTLLVGLVCALLMPPGQAATQQFDLLLRGGRIVDGTGGPAYHADVAIANGRIAVLERGLELEAAEVIDVTGKVVAPGFIDVHTHAEEIVDLPLAENFLRMGVTTLVLGNCGSSVLEIETFFRRLKTNHVSPNIATLVGQGSVRNKVMGGSFMRPPTATELTEMKSLVDRAMRAGAVGLSTGLIYLPGTFTKTDELIELARVAGRYDGIYVSHMRDEGSGILGALEELFQIAREAGCRAQVSHIKLSGPANWGRAAAVLEAIDRARASGLDITQDQYVYTASSTGLAQLIPEQWRDTAVFKEALADAEKKALLKNQMRTNLLAGGRTNYAYAVIAHYKHEPSLNGLTLVEAAQARRGAATLEDQIELALEIHANGGASGVFHGMSDEDLQVFMKHPNTMFGSDSGVRKYQEGVPHPRGYGNAARVLARYVRELGQLRLEDAVRRMTLLPATTFRLKERGQIREGAWADLAVFNPATVADHSGFREPHQYATGFDLVIVNGIVVVRKDTHLGTRPGKTLHRGQ